MGVQINGSTGNVIATRGTFSGNVGIAGTLTYEDVTDIDAVGLITARSGIEVGASPGVGASISRQGNAIFSGITTIGSKEVGTGITLSPDGHISVSGVTTSSTIHIGVDTGVYGEDLVVTGNSRVTGIASFGTSDNPAMHVNVGMSTLSAAPVLTVPDMIKHSGDPETRIRFDTGVVKVETTQYERLRVGPNGQIGINGANYGTSGQVLQSQGSSSAVQWATPASGWVHGAEVSLNGNVSITLTDVPDGASHIRYLIRYMSFSGVAQAKIQLQKSTTGGSKSLITSNYQSFSTYFATSGSSSGGGGNTDGIDIFDAYSATTNNLFGSVDIYRIGTNGSDGTNYLIEHQGFANYNGTLSANFMTNAYIELGTGSTDFISGVKFYGNTGESFDNGYVNQSYLLS